MEPQSYWTTEEIAEEEHNTFPSLEEKSRTSSYSSLAYAMPVEMILCSQMVFLLVHLLLHNCLSVDNFYWICWVAVVSKVWNSYRFHEEKQQHIHPPHWEGDSSMSSFLLDTGVPTQRGRAYQRPHCKKSGKKACSFYNITAFWPEDPLVRGRKFMKLFVSQKGFGVQLLPQSQSWDLWAEVGTCPGAEQGPSVSEKSGVWHMAFQEQCFVTFALEADGKKGRRKEGSR